VGKFADKFNGNSNQPKGGPTGSSHSQNSMKDLSDWQYRQMANTGGFEISEKQSKKCECGRKKDTYNPACHSCMKKFGL